MEFNELKTEILKRAKEASACTEQYKRACRSTNFNELMQVIKDNFDFATRNKIIDPSLIEACKEQFNANQIYCNVDVTEGFLLACGNATVEAWGNATVRAWGNATVRAFGNATVLAWGNATVEAWGNATVRAWGNATVRAFGNATVLAWGNATVKACGNATVEAWGNATVLASGNVTVRAFGNATVEASDNVTVLASGNVTVRAWYNATVRASDNAYITSYYTIECRLRGSAIYRIRGSNTIRYASDNIKFEKVPAYEPEGTEAEKN